MDSVYMSQSSIRNDALAQQSLCPRTYCQYLLCNSIIQLTWSSLVCDVSAINCIPLTHFIIIIYNAGMCSVVFDKNNWSVD